MLGATTQLGDAPSLEQLTGSVQVMLDAFDKGELDRIYLVSNGFVNAMTQQPKVEQLVPLAPAQAGDDPTVLMVGTISTNQKQKNC